MGEIRFYEAWLYTAKLSPDRRYNLSHAHSALLRCIKQYLPFLSSSNLPVVLLAIAGNRLIVSAAIFTDSIYADELFQMKLSFGFHGSDNVLRVARVFVAINRCTDRLRVLYTNLRTSTQPTPPSKFLWPNPTPDPPAPVDATQGLEFFFKVDRLLGTPINRTIIDEENKRHAMYLARMKSEDGTSTTDVFVKFTTKYNADAHRLLASHNPPLAPALYSCTRVIDGIFMVVMQYIPASEGKSLYAISSPPPALHPTRHNALKAFEAVCRDVSKALEAVRRDVSQVLGLLHGQGLVFGDLREVNVLYLEKDDRVLLVDFDSVGRDGKDRYSLCLNPDARLGVEGLQIMEKSHDTENMDRLMGRLSMFRLQRD
jgi:hypothetical protein